VQLLVEVDMHLSQLELQATHVWLMVVLVFATSRAYPTGQKLQFMALLQLTSAVQPVVEEVKGVKPYEQVRQLLGLVFEQLAQGEVHIGMQVKLEVRR
jgi:hypothetical protein